MIVSISKINSVQGFRALGFLMIFIHHVYSNVHSEWPNLGVRGVELFFLLSGFLMVYLHWNDIWGGRRRFDWLLKGIQIYKSKYRRLILLHGLCLLWSVPFVILWHLYDSIGELGISLLLNLGMVHSWFVFSAYSFNPVSWFISTLMTCYLCFPVVLRKLQSLKTEKNLILLALLILAGKLGLELYVNATPANDEIYEFFYLNPVYRIWDFILGGCVGALCRLGKEKNILSYQQASYWQLGMFVLYFGALCLIGQMRNNGYSNIFLLLGCGFLFTIFFDGYISRWLSHRVLVYLGNISMECYFIHVLMIWSVSSVLGKTAKIMNMPGLLHYKGIVAFIGTVILATVIHRFIFRLKK